jgi:hypothetical protein
MKLTLFATMAITAVAVNAGRVYKRETEDFVLSNTAETCSVGDDGTLSCVAGKKAGLDTFTVSPSHPTKTITLTP